MASLLALFGCEDSMYPKILEIADTKIILRQIEHAPDGVIYLHLRGFSFHSSLAVDHVMVSQHDGSTLILVHLVPVRKGKDGNFDLTVRLLNENNTVFFGNNHQVIWPIHT